MERDDITMATADLLYKSGNYADALNQYLHLCSVQETPRSLSNSSACYFNLNDLERAKVVAIECVEKYPQYSKGYYRLAQALQSMGDLESSLKIIDSGLKNIPTDESLQSLYNATIQKLSGVQSDPICYIKPHDHHHEHDVGHHHEHHHEHDVGHHHEHHHEHDLGHHYEDHHEHLETFDIQTSHGTLTLSIFEEGVPPEFRVSYSNWSLPPPDPTGVTATTTRPDGTAQVFEFTPMVDGKMSLLRSTTHIPEPHEFHVDLSYRHDGSVFEFPLEFIEHNHDHGHSHE